MDSDSLEAALEKLVERYPYLIQDGQAEASADRPLPPKTRHPKPMPKGSSRWIVRRWRSGFLRCSTEAVARQPYS